VRILQDRNYNDDVIVVRYVTLVALVIWLGAMAGDQFGDLLQRVPLIPFVCGAAMMVGLFVMKFMGPPPIGFVVRAGIGALMLVMSAAAMFLAPRTASPLLMTANIGLGFLLLIWYVRE
jgi:hypothetical protein